MLQRRWSKPVNVDQRFEKLITTLELHTKQEKNVLLRNLPQCLRELANFFPHPSMGMHVALGLLCQLFRTPPSLFSKLNPSLEDFGINPKNFISELRSFSSGNFTVQNLGHIISGHIIDDRGISSYGYDAFYEFDHNFSRFINHNIFCGIALEVLRDYFEKKQAIGFSLLFSSREDKNDLEFNKRCIELKKQLPNFDHPTQRLSLISGFIFAEKESTKVGDLRYALLEKLSITLSKIPALSSDQCKSFFQEAFTQSSPEAPRRP